MVKEKQKVFRNTYTKCNIIGVFLCILTPVVMILSFFTANALITGVFVAAVLLLISIAVGLFVWVGVQWTSMERLLREGEFAPKAKESVKKANIERFQKLTLLDKEYPKKEKVKKK